MLNAALYLSQLPKVVQGYKGCTKRFHTQMKLVNDCQQWHGSLQLLLCSSILLSILLGLFIVHCFIAALYSYCSLRCVLASDSVLRSLSCFSLLAEVDDGALFLSLYMLSASFMQASL